MQAVCAMKKEQVLAAVAPMVVASPAFAAAQEVASVAMETNILGLIATALFVIIPTSFLITLFVKSESDGQRSGGFSQTYYDKSKKAGNKKTNLAVPMSGKGKGMYTDL
jgi:photosystem II PsbM protein